MSDKPDDIYKVIKTLLDISERSTSNPHEAAIAAQKAALLIEKHNLDLDAIRDWEQAPTVTHDYFFIHEYLPQNWEKKERKPAKNIYHRKHRFASRDWPPKSWYQYGQYEWFIYLAEEIANVCKCKAPYYSPGSVTFIGEKENVKQAIFLMGNIFHRLLVMADTATKEYSENYKKENGISPYRYGGYAHPNRFREGWLEGAAWEIINKLQDRNKERKVTAPAPNEKSLLVINQAITKYKNEHFSHIENKESFEPKDKTRGNASGYLAGEKFGKDFVFQDGLETGSTIKRLSKGE